MADKEKTAAEYMLDHLWALHTERKRTAESAALAYVKSSDQKDKAEAEKYLASAEAFEAARKIVMDYLPGIIHQAKQEGGAV